MELLQFAGEGVRICCRELSSRSRRQEAGPFLGCGPRLVTSSPTIYQPPHDVQHVQRPAALSNGNVFQWFHPTELFADFGCRGDDGLLVGRDVPIAPRLARPVLRSGTATEGGRASPTL